MQLVPSLSKDQPKEPKGRRFESGPRNTEEEEVERFLGAVGKHKDFCIDTMSFDYHLSHPKRGIDVMKYLVDLCDQNNSRKFWPKTVLYHSNDPEGVEIMKAFTTSFEKEILPKYGVSARY